MKKLLFLVTQSTWGGGAQRYVYDLASRLSSDFTITVGAGEGDGSLLDKVSELGLSTHYFPYLKRAVHPYYDLVALGQFKKFFTHHSFDIVHLNSSKTGVLLSPVAAHAKIPKIIYTAHGFVFNEPLSPIKKALYRAAERRTSRYKDAIICVSDFDRTSAIQFCIAPHEKLITIHNGIDADATSFKTKQEAQSLLNIDPSWYVFGTIANFYPTKGLRYFIEACALLKPSPATHIVIIGDGEERPLLESLIIKYNLSHNVHLIGSRHAASTLMRAFDVFVMPSVKEGLPYAILEALAAHLPIIATRVGGIPEIIYNDDSHILVPPADPLALSRALAHMLTHTGTPEQIPPSVDDMVRLTEQVYLS